MTSILCMAAPSFAVALHGKGEGVQDVLMAQRLRQDLEGAGFQCLGR